MYILRVQVRLYTTMYYVHRTLHIPVYGRARLELLYRTSTCTLYRYLATLYYVQCTHSSICTIYLYCVLCTVVYKVLVHRTCTRYKYILCTMY